MSGRFCFVMTMFLRTSPLRPSGSAWRSLTRMLTPPALPTDSTSSPRASNVCDSPCASTRFTRVAPSARTSTQQSACAVSVSTRPLPAAAGSSEGAGIDAVGRQHHRRGERRGRRLRRRAAIAAAAQRQHHGDHGDGAEEQVARTTARPARLERDRDRLALRWREVAVGGDEVGDGLVGVEPEEERVLLDERAREEAAGQRFDAVLLERLQEADADLGAVGDLAQADAAHLALTSQLFREPAHRFRSSRPGRLNPAAARRFYGRPLCSVKPSR
jgi:hypothetical protein